MKREDEMDGSDMTNTSKSEQVRIFDTTLRDGEQSPGATMGTGEKLEVARALARLGVDIIEAGFPAASPDDLLAVKTIAEQIGGGDACEEREAPPTICGLARAYKPDIDRVLEAVAPAAIGRVHTFIATSPIHREHKLRMTEEQVIEKVRTMVSYARERCEDVEFSPEDAGRTEFDFLCQVVETAIEAGAGTVNIPDTVGYTTPAEFAKTIAGLKQHVRGIDDAIISVHCHNDLGMATANTLAGLKAGARQAEVTINGIGERAGNTALEEVVMALRTRGRLFGLSTGIDTRHISRTSKLVSAVTGMLVQPNKAIVGDNAFAHEAGIHQDGVLKHQETYEIMKPESVGVAQSMLVLGKHSGRHGFASRLTELGYSLDNESLDKAFKRFKDLADRKKTITNADLVALVTSEIAQPDEFFSLAGLQVACGSMGMPTATVRLTGPDGATHEKAAIGTGPVDAAFKAIDGIVDVRCDLLEYTVQAVTEGIDALGEVSVRIGNGHTESSRINPQNEASGRPIFHGHGTDTDIIVASAKAYLAALNRLFAIHGKEVETPSDRPEEQQSPAPAELEPDQVTA
jgi:2-isopropylmalate synthase